MITVDEERNEQHAAVLGQLAQAIDGSVAGAEHAAGRARLRSTLTTRQRRSWLPPLMAAAAVMLVIAAGAAGYCALHAPTPLRYHVSGPALQLHDQWLAVAASGGPGVLQFSEGTRLELAPGSSSRVAEVTADGARVLLRAGTLHARVIHRPHTHWSVGAGPYTVEVTGTAFDVSWPTGGDQLELSLREGSVIVRGPALHDGIRVAAGQRLVAHAKTGNAELSSSAAAPKPVNAPAPVVPYVLPARGTSRPAPSWTDLLTGGDFRGVLAQAQTRGVDSTLRRASLADVVALSDAARYAGDRALARRGLLGQRSRFPKSAEAHAAAFVLGRMADDDGSSAEALRWYETYLQQSPRGPFAAEALGRKLVVVVTSGDATAAQAIARLYLQRFPRGAHASYARELLQQP